MNENLTRLELAYIICDLPEETKRLEEMQNILKVGPTHGKAKYRSQKEHWMGWLADHSNAGFYERKNPKNHTAKSIYNAIGCSPMLFWLVETVGLPDRQTQQAFESVTLGEKPPLAKYMRSQCAQIRRIAPWVDIVNILKNYPRLPVEQQSAYDARLEQVRLHNQLK